MYTHFSPLTLSAPVKVKDGANSLVRLDGPPQIGFTPFADRALADLEWDCDGTFIGS